MVHSFDMPTAAAAAGGDADASGRLSNGGSSAAVNGIPGSGKRTSTDVSGVGMQTPGMDDLPGGWPLTPAGLVNGGAKEVTGGKESSVLSVPNGVPHGERAPSAKSMTTSTRSRRSSGFENEKRLGESAKEALVRPGVAEEGYFAQAIPNGKPVAPKSASTLPNGDGTPATPQRSNQANPMTPMLPPVKESSPAQSLQQTPGPDGMLKPPERSSHHRQSSPPAFSHNSASPLSNTASTSPPSGRPDRLIHRHTLEVPKIATGRTSRDSSEQPVGSSEGVVSATGRFSPNTPTKRRGSLQLARRATRSIHSDFHPDDVPQDEDAARWTEHIRAKRASKKARADTDDDRVVVGTKVDEHHVNWVTAYNMLTGIRFTVSRTNAKLDRDLTDADFKARHKFSFDITGNELTPSAKYDFKFKDYAPWVFRHLRAKFRLDPAEYLVSLTSKYILSELGSPGKSGSFFYFSRDYKYIIKTIHHGEHKFLRKILKEYYNHVTENPNTLLSQFYGLHRVKIPYGRKIHFVVMNNLFPPHRDIHRTFDLKGSTIGRDFKEDELEKNPRATLKDLNWLRRNLHLEFGPTKKEAFVEQMQRDVALLQRLKIMDYSLLVGIHDLERGNEEQLRDKTLKVFQPGGGGKPEDQMQMGPLMRTSSKLETAKRAQELRKMVKMERPVPIEETLDKMPEEAHRKGFYFYADDGGFQATRESDMPGEEIYYLGIIDCLTRYNVVKKAEHFWKGMGGNESQISPIPPERYGDRFVKFISGITMSRERAEQTRLSTTLETATGVSLPSGFGEPPLNDPCLNGINIQKDKANPPGTARVIEKAERSAEQNSSRRHHGPDEKDVPDRSLGAVGQPDSEGAVLPVIGEAAENASQASKPPSRASPKASYEDFRRTKPVLGNANMPSDAIGEVPPPTPPKLNGSSSSRDDREGRPSWGGGPPPTPPKDDKFRGSRLSAGDGDRGRLSVESRDKELPHLPPVANATMSHSPSRADGFEMAGARR